MQMQGLVGVQNNGDSSIPITQAFDQQGNALVTEFHGRYYQMAARGNLLILDSDSVTLAAAHTTKGAAATIKFINGFYNPLSSSVNYELLFAKVATVSGTPAGGYFYNVQNMGAGIGATVATGTIRSSLQSTVGASANVTAQALVNVVVSRTDAATTAFTQLAAMGGPTAVAATGAVEDATDEIAGRIIVGPGFAFGICGTGAGTSHVVQSTIYMAQVPIIR